MLDVERGWEPRLDYGSHGTYGKGINLCAFDEVDRPYPRSGLLEMDQGLGVGGFLFGGHEKLPIAFLILGRKKGPAFDGDDLFFDGEVGFAQREDLPERVVGRACLENCEFKPSFTSPGPRPGVTVVAVSSAGKDGSIRIL